MANLKLKDSNKLETWNSKELRKMKITLQNRLKAFESSDKPKPLTKSHLLFNMSSEKCEDFLKKIVTEEKNR